MKLVRAGIRILGFVLSAHAFAAPTVSTPASSTTAPKPGWKLPPVAEQFSRQLRADIIEASLRDDPAALRERLKVNLQKSVDFARRMGWRGVPAEWIPRPLRNAGLRFRDAVRSFAGRNRFVQELNTKLDQYLARVRADTLEQVRNYKFSETPEFRQILEPGHGLDVKDPTLREMAHDILPKFYDGLPAPMKAPIMVRVLRLPAGATDEERLLAFLVESPSMVQKFFQLVGEDAESPLVRNVMKQLLSNLKKIPYEDGVERILTHNLGRPPEEVFEWISREPLAAASMGQTHLARLRGSGQEVVVKVLREGIRDAVGQEWGVFARVTPPRLRGTVDRLALSVLKEADLTREARNGDFAKVSMEKPAQGLKVAARVPKVPAAPGVLVMERAPGTQLSKVDSPELEELAARALATELEDWFENALFGDGKFHGDLHGGNAFLEAKTGAPGFALTAIDFGHYGQLEKFEQAGIVDLFLAAATNSPRDAIEAMEKITGRMITGIDQGDLSLRFKRTFSLNLPLKERLSALIIDGLDSGLAVPEGLLSFDRGRDLIERQLTARRARLREMGKGELADQLAPDRLYENVFRRQSAKHFPRLLVPGQKVIGAGGYMKLLEVLAKPELREGKSEGGASSEPPRIPPRQAAAQAAHGGAPEAPGTLAVRVQASEGKPLKRPQLEDLSAALSHPDTRVGDAARRVFVHSNDACEAYLKHLVSGTSRRSP